MQVECMQRTCCLLCRLWSFASAALLGPRGGLKPDRSRTGEVCGNGHSRDTAPQVEPVEKSAGCASPSCSLSPQQQASSGQNGKGGCACGEGPLPRCSSRLRHLQEGLGTARLWPERPAAASQWKSSRQGREQAQGSLGRRPGSLWQALGSPSARQATGEPWRGSPEQPLGAPLAHQMCGPQAPARLVFGLLARMGCSRSPALS